MTILRVPFWFLLSILCATGGGTAVAQAQTRAYVAGGSPSGSVFVLDTTTNTLVTTIAVGEGTFGIVVTPDGSRVYVATQSASQVAVIDTATNTVVDRIPVGV